MKLRSGSILGLAIADRRIITAEVNSAGGGEGRASVTRTATFTLPESLSFDRPEAVGQAFRAFLKSEGFSASRAVLGLPARLLMARDKQVPPASPSVAADLLRIQAERQFAPELKDLVYDYAGHPDAASPRTVLLLAAARDQVTRAREFADAADLHLVAVTPTTLALSNALTKGAHAGAMVVSLTGDAAEVASRTTAGPRLLRHLSVAPRNLAGSNGTASAALASLGGELLRAAAANAEPTAEVVLVDGIGLPADAAATIESRSGLAVRHVRDLSPLAASTATTADAAPAVALALAGLSHDLLPANFLKSRLAPPKQRRLTRNAQLGILAGVLAAVVLGAAGYDVYDKQSELNALKAHLAEDAPTVKENQAKIDRLNYARGWYENRTPLLDVLKAITESFPQQGSVWATSFIFKDNGKGTLQGRATDQRSITDVSDRIKKDHRFTDVTTEYHEAGGQSRDVIFTLTFTFTPI